MPIHVSVVIPVYNPGPHIDDCVDSLRRQTLPAEEFEAIFVDDGSTDDTPAHLDRLATEHSWLRVLHQENSGWPGQPRNVGIDAARGTYVYFLDDDDFLGDDALRRMHAYAVANDADVLVGKMAGRGRRVPRELFRRNQPRATLADSCLIDSLTPHKLCRRRFLDDAAIRFPEGRRRLEDHVFVIEAYVRARRISVLSDYVCYFHTRREDSGNAALRRIDPVSYLANLSEALDLVDEHVPPGEVHDKLYRRWLRVEMMERLRGRKLLDKEPEHRREWFDAIAALLHARYRPQVLAGLAPAQRAVAETTAAGRFDELVRYAEWEQHLWVRPTLDEAFWDGKALRLAFRAELRAGGREVRFQHEPQDVGVAGPGRDVVILPGLGAEARRLDVTSALPDARADLLLRRPTTGAEHYVPVELWADREVVAGAPLGTFRLVLRGRATVDPAKAAAGAALEPARWVARVRFTLAGWTVSRGLGKRRRREFVSVPSWISRTGVLALRLHRRPAAASVAVSGRRACLSAGRAAQLRQVARRRARRTIRRAKRAVARRAPRQARHLPRRAWERLCGPAGVASATTRRDGGRG